MSKRLNKSISPLDANAWAVKSPEGLSADDVRTLYELEAVTAKRKESFIDAGLALEKIYEEKLFREHYESFESYCFQRWGLPFARAYLLTESAELAKHLSAIPGTVPPTKQSQVQRLVGVPLDVAVKIWTHANLKASGKPVVGHHLRDAIRAHFAIADLLESVRNTCRYLADEIGEIDLSGLDPKDKSRLESAAKEVLQLAAKAGLVVRQDAKDVLDLDGEEVQDD